VCDECPDDDDDLLEKRGLAVTHEPAESTWEAL
jgi:hypothetical protein